MRKEWTNKPSRERDDFMFHASKTLNCHHYTDALDNSDDWGTMMGHFGFREEFQDVVLDSRFKDIRLTESAEYWINKTFEIRYRALILEATYSSSNLDSSNPISNHPF
jgi:hypothetical protein